MLLENGQSAQLIVEKDNRPEKEAVITQPHLMVVMIVWGGESKEVKSCNSGPCSGSLAVK